LSFFVVLARQALPKALPSASESGVACPNQP
jgi:hypothetical protein